MNSIFPDKAPTMNLRFGALPKGDEAMLIAGMFTPSHAKAAERLVKSLRKFGLPHALFEIPTVHRSISPKGTLDPRYTKANFIWHVIDQARRPVLYLDVDMVIRRMPELIPQIIAQGHDFAILNWFALKCNDVWLPIPQDPANPEKMSANRFFCYSGCVDFVSNDQLACSGAVQLWGNTPAAVSLLAGWHDTILSHPGVADDQCLDFAFNNRLGGWEGSLRPFWLPKSYVRIAWWIFDEPVIDHPGYPYPGSDWAQFDDSAQVKRLYPERMARRNRPPPIPRDVVIDIKTGDFIRIQNNQPVRAGKIPMKIWV